MNGERLKCYGDCPFRNGSLIRPCSEEVCDNNGTCIENIQNNPLLGEFGNISVSASMDNLINHQVEVAVGKELVAIVDRGIIIKLRFEKQVPEVIINHARIDN